MRFRFNGYRRVTVTRSRSPTTRSVKKHPNGVGTFRYQRSWAIPYGISPDSVATSTPLRSPRLDDEQSGRQQGVYGNATLSIMWRIQCFDIRKTPSGYEKAVTMAATRLGGRSLSVSFLVLTSVDPLEDSLIYRLSVSND